LNAHRSDRPSGGRFFLRIFTIDHVGDIDVEIEPSIDRNIETKMDWFNPKS
jgi:hypothetical protein